MWFREAEMNRDPNKKIIRYLEGLEKTNRYLMIALREMQKYIASIEKANEELKKQLNDTKASSGAVAFGKQRKKFPVTDHLFELIMDMPEGQQKALLHDLDLLRDAEMKSSEDTRENIRKPYNMVVDYVVQDRFCNDFIQNISAGGMFIETRMPFLVGQDITLTFPLPKDRKHVKVAGEVIRKTPQGIGVKFKIDSEEQEKLIKSLLETL
jgi:uncharacterized protein (TIGR02266 family)